MVRKISPVRAIRRALKYGDELFKGRSVVVGQIVSRVAAGENVSVVGERKIGKTSVLNHVAGELMKSGHLVAELDCLRVHPRMNRILVERLSKLIAAGAGKQEEAEKSEAEGDDSDLFVAFEGLLENTCDNLPEESRLVLVMDEVEELVKFKGFLGFLKALSQDLDPLVLAFASYDALSEVAREEAPNFFTIFKEVRLTGIESVAEVQRLLEIRARRDLPQAQRVGQGAEEGGTATFGVGAVEQLRRTTGFNPFYVQEMYSQVLGILREEERTVVEREDCERAEEVLLRDQFIRSHLRDRWEWSGEEVGTILSVLADDKLAEKSREHIQEFLRNAKVVLKGVGDLLDRAVQVGLIVQHGDRYIFSSGIVESWVRENKKFTAP